MFGSITFDEGETRFCIAGSAGLSTMGAWDDEQVYIPE